MLMGLFSQQTMIENNFVSTLDAQEKYNTTWTFMLSSASTSFPLKISPSIVSTVIVWPSASCRTLIGTPIDMWDYYSETIKITIRYVNQ